MTQRRTKKSNNNGNGHQDFDFGAAGEGFGVNSDDFFGSMFGDMEHDSFGKYLAEPGKEITDLLMRTAFKDTGLPDLRVVVRCLARYEKFGDDRHKKMLKNLCAGAVSILGRSRFELLMAKTNIIATNVLEKFLATDLRSGRGGKKNGQHSLLHSNGQTAEDGESY